MASIIGHVFMSVDKFLEIEDYYANRDAKKRAIKKEHLKGEHSATQASVAIADTPDGFVKIDGHSRAAAWSLGTLSRPENLSVTIYKVDDMEEMATLYSEFCSKDTAQTPAEMMDHAMKLADFSPQSKLVRSSWKSAFKVIGENDPVKGLSTYKDELLIIDSWGIDKTSSKEFSVGVRAAILQTLKSDLEIAMDFWGDYLKSESTYAEVNRLKAILEERGNVSSGYQVGIIYSTGVGCFESFKLKKQL